MSVVLRQKIPSLTDLNRIKFVKIAFTSFLLIKIDKYNLFLNWIQLKGR